MARLRMRIARKTLMNHASPRAMAISLAAHDTMGDMFGYPIGHPRHKITGDEFIKQQLALENARR